MRTSIALCLLIVVGSPVVAGDVPKEYRPMIEKGLKWVAGEQRLDGSWSASGGQYPVAITSMAGLALLAEGSTPEKGQYSKQLRKATDWLMSRSDGTGLIAPDEAQFRHRYIFSHGYSMLFLACVYGKTEDRERRRRLGSILNRGVRFAVEAQSPNGGFGYVSGKDSSGYAEGATTTVMIQGLRAARDAGIPVPRKTLNAARKYFEKSTTDKGGVVYNLSSGRRNGTGRPALTAGALACLPASEYSGAFAKKWVGFCRDRDLTTKANFGHEEFTQFYFAQCMYALGETGYSKLFPQSDDGARMRWSDYRTRMFDRWKQLQKDDGRFDVTTIGPIYRTSLFLTVLQFDKEAIPFFASKVAK